MTALEVYNHTGQLLRAIAGIEEAVKLGKVKPAELDPQFAMHLKNKAKYEKANAKAEAQIAEELKQWYA